MADLRLALPRRSVVLDPQPVVSMDTGAAGVWDRVAAAAASIGKDISGIIERDELRARTTALAQGELADRAKALDLEAQFPDDPVAFEQGWAQYSAGTINSTDPDLAVDRELILGDIGLDSRARLQRSRLARDEGLQRQTINATVKSAEDRMLIEMGNGRGGSPEYQTAERAFNSSLDMAVQLGFMSAEEAKIARDDMPLRQQEALDKGFALRDPAGYLGGGYLATLKGAESGGANIPNQAGTSSAFGPYQFVAGTWRDLMQRHPELGLTEEGRMDAAQQERAIGAFTLDNMAALERDLGREPNAAETYLAHFLGAADAAVVISADAGYPVEELVSARSVAANRSILAGKTAGDIRAWAEGKFGTGPVDLTPSTSEGLPIEVQVEHRNLAQSELNRQQAHAWATLAPIYDDQTALALRGEEPTISRGALIAARGPEEGVRLYDELQGAYRLGRNKNAVSLMTPPEQQALLASMIPEGEGAAAEAVLYADMQRAVAADRAEWEADPAAAAMAHDSTVRSAFEAAQANPAKLGDAIRLSEQVQAAKGIPADLRRPLTKDVAERSVAEWVSEVANGVRLDSLEGLMAQAGDEDTSRRVLGQLVEAGLPEGVPEVLDAAQAGRRHQALRALGAITATENVKLDSALDSDVKIAARTIFFEEGVGAALAEQARLTGNSAFMDRGLQQGELVNKASRAAAFASGDADASAAQGYDDLFGHLGFLVDDDLGAVVFPAGTDAAKLERGLENLRATVGEVLTPDAIAALIEADDTVSRRMVEASTGDLATEAQWINDGDGYALVDPVTGGVLIRNDGSRYRVSLGAVMAAGVTGPRAPLPWEATAAVPRPWEAPP